MFVFDQAVLHLGDFFRLETMSSRRSGAGHGVTSLSTSAFREDIYNNSKQVSRSK